MAPCQASLSAVGASLCYSLARVVGKEVAMDYVPERVERFRLRLSPNWALNMASGVLGRIYNDDGLLI